MSGSVNTVILVSDLGKDPREGTAQDAGSTADPTGLRANT